MKGRIMTICFLLTGGLLAGCSSTPKVPEGEFLMQGELANVPDSTVILLLKENGNLLTTIQKDTVIKRKFYFPRYHQAVVNPKNYSYYPMIKDSPACAECMDTIRKIHPHNRKRPSPSFMERQQ